MTDTLEKTSVLRLMESLKAASASAHQLAHARRDARYLAIRDMLEIIHSTSVKMVTQKGLNEQGLANAIDVRQRMISTAH